MSLKRLAVISAVGSHNSFNNQTISYISSYSGASGSVEQGIIVGHAGSGNLRSGGAGGHHQGLQTMRPGANLHGNVNIMLGGAMLSVVITVVCFVCYCCHRNIKKRSNSLYRQQWLETDTNMEIYSVEQCYDPPPTGTATGGFFMDGSGGSDYQPLPMVTSAINHASHHPSYPYHHQHYHLQQHQQQQHHYQYTPPYPNGPPPSYDTVVAQDELLASASRRKRAFADDTRPGDGEAGSSSSSSAHHSCSSDHESEKQSICNGATPLLPKTGTIRSPRSRDISAASVIRTYSDDPAAESLCRGELGWRDEQRTSCNCPTVTGGASISGPVPPIYCRNCGYFVEGGSSAHRPLSNAIELTRNEPLLVDYEATPTGDTVNRNNVTGGTTAPVAITPPTVDVDMRTMRMIASCSPTLATGRFDTLNNNNGAANETERLHYTPPPPPPPAASNLSTTQPSLAVEDEQQQTHPAVTGESSSAASSENNNIIIDSSPVNQRRDAPIDDIIHQCPNTSNQCCNQPASTYLHAAEEGAGSAVNGDRNGNTDSSTPTTTDGAMEELHSAGAVAPSGIRSLLNENGLVRLDMSQIIDNTGLPTYEAALKLESSGYV